MVGGTEITYVTLANSVNGPFTSPLTITSGDSLFIKMDVTPLGAVQTTYYLDVNENHVIDSTDLLIDGEFIFDNNTMPPGMIDLDMTEGVIVAFLDTETPPSMTVIIEAKEDEDSVTAIVIFENRPAIYTLSGNIYDQEGHDLVGAWVFVSDSTGTVADASDTLGYYSVPVNAGTYDIEVKHLSGIYSSFDTTIFISGNTTLDATLSRLTSYIRGYVRDESSDPISNVEVWNDRGANTITDTNGMYVLMVTSGSGMFGLNDETLLPNHLNPQTHNYTIGEGDSIVNNSVSNFVCYTANSTISGQVLENGSVPGRSYRLFGWSDILQNTTWTISDQSGNYSLPVHSSMLMPMYNVNIDDWDDRYPWLPGYYPDTMYSFISPYTSGIDFNFLPAETLFADPFTGDMISPDWGSWNTFVSGSPYGGSTVQIENNRLKVHSISSSGTSGYGILSRKPFSIHNREYRVYVDNSMLMETNNSVRIILTDKQWNWEGPESFRNSLQLVFERNMLNERRWRLMRTVDGVSSDIWTSSDSTGHHILFQFIDPDTLVLKIHGIEDYRGQWGNHFSMAYVYLSEFNTYNETSAPVYFDEFFVGPLGATSVRELGGPQLREFSINQNYPNPFNPVTLIQYEVPMQSRITIDVYNILGEHVSTLVNELQSAGRYEASFYGNQLPSGVYYYRMNASDPGTGIIRASEMKKAILIK